MPNYIPFIFSNKDIDLLKDYYADTKCVRIALEKTDLIKLIPSNLKIWLDANVDIFHNRLPADNKLRKIYSKFDPNDLISDADFQRSPDRQYLQEFIYSILNHCSAYNPYLLSIPQLPLVEKPNRYKINKLMLQFTVEWQEKQKYRGGWILPLIICNQSLINRKPLRDRIIEYVKKSNDIRNLAGIWAVESTLNDNQASGTFGTKRFPNLIEFHKSLRQSINPNTKIIAGPYWGMNLILWARGLITHMAFGLGKGYQYFIASGTRRTGSARIALPPLKRLVVVEGELEEWLKKARKHLKGDPITSLAFEDILRNLKNYYANETAHMQVAKFYKEWISSYDNLPPDGRALALYQDFSNAFVLGKKIKRLLPPSAKSARAPEKVVQQFMLNTL